MISGREDTKKQRENLENFEGNKWEKHILKNTNKQGKCMR